MDFDVDGVDSSTLDFLHLNKILLVACLQVLTMAYMDINRQARTTERAP